ncbi:MAG: efflux RND transporter permease subunit [Pseudomonadales bacterium]
MSEEPLQRGGLISWFAHNHVAANLMMLLIIAFGIYSGINIRKEMMPSIDTNMIRFQMIYPGAAPGEVEEGIVLKVEEALKDLDGVKRIESRSMESAASVVIEIENGYDVNEQMNKIKISIDGISSFPEQAEKPTIEMVEMTMQALILQLSGNIDEASGKMLSEQIKSELLSKTEASKIDIWGVRDFEITIEVTELTLRKYGITLSQIADKIRASSVDLPAGSIKTNAGQIMLRTQGQARMQQDFERLVLLTEEDGTRITLGDIAIINDGFVDQDGFAIFNGGYSVGMAVYAIGNQDVIKVAESVKQYVDERRRTLPQGVDMVYWVDTTDFLNARMVMMLKNLGLGVLLVLLVLSLFMEIKTAFWVMVGLPLTFLGALAVMSISAIDISINMFSTFGFIMVLGIVVDDAIIIGESVNSTTREKGHSLRSVIEGAQKVATPATFGVLTTICAFIPLLLTDSIYSALPASIGWVVILSLIFSLIESKWILPAHLSHMHTGLFRWVHSNRQDRFQQRNNNRLQKFIVEIYQPFLKRCLEARYTTMAVFLGMLILVGGLVGGGLVRYVLMPDSPGNYLQVNLDMVRGTPDHKTREAIDQIHGSLLNVAAVIQEETGIDIVKNDFRTGRDGRTGWFMIELNDVEGSGITVVDIADRLREDIGEVVGARSVSVSALEGPGGSDIKFNLVGHDRDALDAAAAELEHKLRQYHGTYDVRNGSSDLVNEIHIDIKPSAEALGFTLMELGSQVREAFYGAEAQRIQRGNEEVKVMVRYPKAQRTNLADLEDMYIRTRDGSEVPILSVAELSVKPGAAERIRIDRESSVPVSAMVYKDILEPNSVVNDIERDFFPELFTRYPNISYRLDGMSKEAVNIQVQLGLGMLVALFGIYGLLAIPLKSYSQPIIIMSVIPFGIIGAIFGHMILGIAVSMMSLFGVIALSGVVVNDSLILVEFINRAVARGESVEDAVIGAGKLRFRAILLTSLTTFFGISPMLLETSAQAQMLIPMAASIAFGIVFATVITLLLVPCLYLVLHDMGVLKTPVANDETLDLSPAEA